MTGAGYEERGRARHRHLAASLDRDVAHWVEATRRSPLLEKHHSQVVCLAGMLDACRRDLGELPDDESRERILDLHHVWDFFRSKLILRCLPQYQAFLDTADELAWACYEPAWPADGPAARPVPPLLFLNRAEAPFALARGSDYKAFLPSGVRTHTGEEAAQQLPFPIIGVPWYQTEHLPGLLAVAHEVGHHVEDDLGLTGTLRDRLHTSGLDAGRLIIWDGWLGEVFADVCACLACGPAYTDTLADALTAVGTRRSAAYPPSLLRLRICRTVLGSSGPAPAGEVAAVVEALTADGYPQLGGRTLRDALGCAEALELEPPALNLLNGLDSEIRDPRAALAAAARAFLLDPAQYDRGNVGARVCREVLARRPVGLRSAEAAADDGARQAGAAAGHALAALLAGAE
ncbi:hypothetical protein [Streptomyces sp. CB01881]|uniref:hypothetical protein n=1 Tax=Streptomyces sp. CB01881 TaxID=2078691 RepID=UPI000CDC668E|nr:hypothetical protein [Streptomyces sp. CB01881]AUY52677.1 hypothetical protein C2142_31440 [Streptomyces sp. CB01881]TYC70395.1 hypothetical protein EH183_31505 [Streptomyces sp. CB01881]